MPIGGLYATYHLWREPGNSIETSLFWGGDLFSGFLESVSWLVDPYLCPWEDPSFRLGRLDIHAASQEMRASPNFRFLRESRHREMEIWWLGRSMEMEDPNWKWKEAIGFGSKVSRLWKKFTLSLSHFRSRWNYPFTKFLGHPSSGLSQSMVGNSIVFVWFYMVISKQSFHHVFFVSPISWSKGSISQTKDKSKNGGWFPENHWKGCPLQMADCLSTCRAALVAHESFQLKHLYRPLISGDFARRTRHNRQLWGLVHVTQCVKFWKLPWLQLNPSVLEFF